MASVKTLHPRYYLAQDIWRMTRAASAGQKAIKDGATLYLPDFVPADEERYKQYIDRAYYMGVTGRTKNSMIGMIFRKPPTYNIPPAIEALMEDIDGAGQSLEQLAKEAAGNILETGRQCFLVDYPQADEGISKEEEARLGLRPTIASYPAESLINWRFEGIKGRQMLTLAVLAEQTEDEERDEFSHDYETTYRVLRLKDGVYTQQIYDDAGMPKGEPYSPLMAGGGTFDHIPLHIAGSEDNRPDVDMPPLYDLATVNIAHYQTTADHRENLFIHGQLTLGITTEMGWDEFQEANPDGIKVGARSGHYLGNNGGFTTATAPESSSLRLALQDLEQQMVALGARLVQRGGQAETAEAARINASAEASTLDVMTSNLSEAIEAALEDIALFMGLPPEAIEYQLNREFWESGLDAQSLQAVIQGRQLNIYAATDALHMIRSGTIQLRDDRTDEQIQQDVASSLLDDPETMPV